MGVHHGHHLVDGAPEVQHCRGFGQDLCGQRSDDVYAKNLAGLLFGNDFDEAAVSIQNRSLAVAYEREFSGLHVVATFAGPRFR